MDIVCDTNVWYRLEDGRLSLRTATSEGKRLHITPVSVLELLARCDESSFERRRRVAQIMIEKGASMLRDQDSELIVTWGLEPREPAWDYRSWLVTFATAENFSVLEQARYRDVCGGEVDGGLEELKRWRSEVYPEHIGIVTKYADGVRPGYADARPGFLRGDPQSETAQRNALDNDDERRLSLLATYERAAKVAAGTPSDTPSEEQISRAESMLRPYVDMATEYAIRCTQRYAPDENDLGDRELFAYAHTGKLILTFDKRWLNIAEESGYGSLLHHAATCN